MKISVKSDLSILLKELNKQITTEDREQYIRDHGPISRGNLSRYMNGHIWNVDKAIQMIDFFKARVAERKEKIESILN